MHRKPSERREGGYRVLQVRGWTDNLTAEACCRIREGEMYVACFVPDPV